MRTAYLFHLCVYSLPMLAGMLVLLFRRYRSKTWSVLRAIGLPIVLVAAWLTAADHLAISQGIWFFGADKHLGIYLGVVPIEEALFFLITNSLIGLALALFTNHRASVSA